MYVNISGYKFINLDNLEALRPKLRKFCQDLQLKGTILLSHEGINAFLSGHRENIDQFTASLPEFGLPKIIFKESPSDEQPFKRMLVKIKQEIIAMGQAQIKPANAPAPYIDAETLDEWIEQEKDFILLDTRNDYEYHLGTFKNAKTLDIDHFRQFPKAMDDFSEAEKQKPIVTFCTGGIRCEKAAPYLIERGFDKVFQLDGGILKYFEERGQSHFEGECFVFDKRVAVGADLAETETIQCFACRKPLLPEDRESADYVYGESCPNCAEG